jgi:type VI secretion system secreted protein VgrG
MDPRKLEFELYLDGRDPADFHVLGLTAHEALSRGMVCSVEAVGDKFDVEKFLGKPAAACGRFGADESPRWFHGLVLDAAVQPLPHDVFRYEVVIGARLELLKIGRDSRIFQNLSVKDVVSKVLDGAGLAGAYDWVTKATYPPREYIVQQNESDYDFVTRLLFEEGIGFVVRNDDTEDRVIFFDDDGVIKPLEGKPQILDRDSTRFARDVAFEVGVTHAAVSDQACLRDYNFKKPALDLTVTEKAPATAGREVYLHPGDYSEVSVGKQRVKRLLERLRLGVQVLRGGCNNPHVEPGRTFVVGGTERTEAGVDLLVLDVVHRAYGDAEEDRPTTYENQFTAVPKTVPFRPTASAPQPCLGGTQVAFVSCPAGEEIHADQFGRVKVRFPWDRSGIKDDKSSTWLRVGQLALGGSMIIPRGKFEVLVDFEGGDIDRPCVAGHLYNADSPPPYALPGGCTKSSIQTATTGGGPGANELRFDDAAGNEHIFLNASKDYTVSVENDSASTAGANESYHVGSNNVLSVGTDMGCSVGAGRTLSVGANQNVNVGGNLTESVGGPLSVTVGAARMVKVGGDHRENVTSTLSRTVGSLQSVTGIAGYERKITAGSTTKVGAAWAEIVGGARNITVKGNFTETVGALKFIKATGVAVACGGAYAMTAAAEKVKCGGSRTDKAKGAVTYTAAGAIKIKAATITLGGASKVSVKGGACSIELTSSGQVTIKAPTVILSGTKALNQVAHKSN